MRAFLPLVLSFAAAASAIRSCGSKPSDNVLLSHQDFAAREDAEDRLAARGVAAPRPKALEDQKNIKTYVHVIGGNGTHYNTTSEANIELQIAKLNEHYVGTSFSFTLQKPINYVKNDKWVGVYDGTPAEFEMKSTLRKGSYSDLNLYFDLIAGGEVLGYATFPEKCPSDTTFALDGVVIDPNTLPNGKKPYDLGITAVHEVGHWLHLLHTFQPGSSDPKTGGCVGHGDYVRDTPAEGFAAWGCQPRRDTCPQNLENKWSISGTDPVHNFMDYSDDSCLTEFTPGQIRRMKLGWEEFRATPCPTTSSTAIPTPTPPGIAGRRLAKPGSWP